MFTGRFAKFAATATMLGAVLAGLGTVTTGQTTTAQPKEKVKAKLKESLKEKAKDKAKEKAAAPAAAPLDLNKATAEELVENLPGVGEVTAKKIVAGRPYTKVDDLAKAGVPARTIDGIRSLVTVSQAPAPAAAATEPAAKSKVMQKKRAAATPAAPPATPLDLNKATAEELVENLPGVGEVTAKKIVAGRPYTKVDDLAKAGVPTRTIDGIRSLVTVSQAPAPAAAATEPAAKSKVMQKKRAAATPAAPPATPLDLNKATAEELVENLPGVGEVTAKKIVAGRPYTKVDDLAKAGVPTRTIDGIRDLVTVAPAPAAAPAAVSEPTPKEKMVRKKAAASTSEPAAPGATATKTAKSKEAGKAKAKAKAALAPGQKVNLNTASKEELDVLPGIGPVRAQAIIEGRPFKKIEDIKTIKGIKDFEFGLIKDIITVD